ncbi:MAG: sugar ABC transporter ATP-binding protein [Rhodospirillales bacterium]|nr:sugar ABC transporter ATP-binding protein [Rhodospirillales bacterium]
MAGATLELDGIGKSFPGVRALQDVSVRFAPGSIHALLGENGAGKSTLIRIITGVHPPDAGSMAIDGHAVRFVHPTDAIAAGIGVVHQERNLIPHFSVGENLLLERVALGTVRPIRFAALHAEAARWLRMVGLEIDPRRPVAGLSVAAMQMIEIARALSLQSRVLLLDEPTASLTPHETDALLLILRRLRDQGVAIVFVSHKLEEVTALCDTVTVLRDGRNACAGLPLAGMTRGDLVRLMVGRDEQVMQDVAAGARGAAALELRGVATAAGHRGIDLALHDGEVLGVYGLVGAGRSELARAVIGLDRITAGELRVRGRAVRIRSVGQALHRHGIGYVSEDRKQEGVILLHGVLANAGITLWRRLRQWRVWLRDGRIARAVLPVLRQLDVRMTSLDAPVATLSGGNQQKVSLAKWLAARTGILIIDEPTVGIDVRTKAYLHGLIRDLARGGTAVLVISSDMPELIALADRIVVMHAYRVAGELANSRDYAAMSRAIMGLIHAGPDAA